MLPVDPRSGQDSGTSAPPARRSPVLPEQAMARGSTIIRPGAVAWGSFRDTLEGAYSSCETVEQLLAAVGRDSGQLGVLLAELTRARLWVPLPTGPQRFTDGTAVVLPTVRSAGSDFIPCFTSVQRLNSWATGCAGRPLAPGTGEYGFADVGRRWQRAGDSRVIPHIVVPAAGLAQRLPPGTGLILNPDCEACLPLYPESVAYLARLADRPEPGAAAPGTATAARSVSPGALVGDPPTEPVALLREARAGLRALPAVRQAARAWLTVPGQGEGLVISVTLDDPASEPDRAAVVAALEDAVAEVPLQAPFPVDVTFPGEVPNPGEGGPDPGEGGPDLIDAWVAANAHPFYTRSEP